MAFRVEGSYRDGGYKVCLENRPVNLEKDGKQMALGCHSPLQGTWCSSSWKCISPRPPLKTCLQTVSANQKLCYPRTDRSSSPEVQGFPGFMFREHDKNMHLYKCVFSLGRQYMAFIRLSVRSLV